MARMRRPTRLACAAATLALLSAGGCDTSTTLLVGWGWIDPPEAAAPEARTADDVAPPAPVEPATLTARPPLPATLPPDAVRLSGPEIRAAFAGMRERYTGIDMAGFTSTGAWLDETMSATWMKDGGISGHFAGAWRVDGDLRCIDYRSGFLAPQTECTAIYRHGGGYLSVNPDGSLHGYHMLMPR